MKIGTVSATLATVGLIAGCGGSSNTSTPSATPTPTTASTPAPASGAPTTPSSAVPSFASSANCLQLAGVGLKFAQAMQAAGGTAAGGGKAGLQAAATAYQDLANAAPSAIQPDLKTIAQAFSKFAAALASTGYTIGQAPTPSQAAALQSATQVFSQPQLRTAEQNVGTWARQNCTHP